MKSKLEEWYGCTHEGLVIPGGVDTDRFQPSSGVRSKLISDNINFLTIRRLTPRMGIERLIYDFAKLQETHPHTHLYIGGDGPLRSSLERQVSRQGINSSVTFLGYINESILPDTYATADIFVLPTTSLEGFGLATLEALASATPVIATDVGGTPEILGPLNKQFSESIPLLVSDHSQLLEGLRAWSDCPQSMRNKVAQAAREYVVSEYTWERTTSRLEDSFKQLIRTQQ
jgi:glycosyltransferase involved in cell wall biosynthesis